MQPVVFIGDDFTGASDTLATFSRAGWRARLFLDAPVPEECAGFDAIGIATNLRALPSAQATDRIARIWPGIAALNPQIIHLKVCSTFDSSARIGSIGAVAQALTARFRPDHVAVIGGQPSLGRYCVFGNLFARAADGKTYRIDRHPVMSCHPVTPMTEADLRLVLAAQGLEGLAMLDPDTVADLPTDDVLHGLFDCTTPADIAKIGAALRRRGGRQLLIGASSVAQALVSDHSGSATAPDLPPPPNGRVLAFAGSRSSVTRQQVTASRLYIRLRVGLQDLQQPDKIVTEACTYLDVGLPTLLHTDPDADYGLPPDTLAELSANLIDAILSRTPVGWLAIAGGDTSSRVCNHLGFTAIDYIATLSPGVGLCYATHTRADRHGMRLVLKGGQMGTEDLFDRFASDVTE